MQSVDPEDAKRVKEKQRREDLQEALEMINDQGQAREVGPVPCGVGLPIGYNIHSEGIGSHDGWE